jgi:UrcA family protein
MFTHSFSHLRRAMFGVALVAGATVSIPVLAAATDAPQRVVQYTDADLASEARVTALYEKLQGASRSVCRSLKGTDIRSVRNYQDCYAQALAEAVDAVNEQTLTALHNEPGAKSARTAARARTERRS